MLKPLDPQRLNALAREEDVDDDLDFTLHHHMSTVRKEISEDDDWGLGVWNLLMEGGRWMVNIRRTRSMERGETKGSDEWYIFFYVRAVVLAHSTSIADPPTRIFHFKISLFDQILEAAASSMSVQMGNASSLFRSWDVVRIGLHCARGFGSTVMQLS